MSSKKKFKTESKQILDLMIHSIYSNKDVFLRELISNASDALDKRHFYSIQDSDYAYDKLAIELSFDKNERTITIKDNGIGMNQEELDQNLGTIAKSGTKEFLENLAKEDQETVANQIGQFGVGFYSSFIVADKVTVITKKPNDKGYKWISDGAEYYEVTEDDAAEVGTSITLHLRDGEEYTEFLSQEKIQELVKKYSDYISYPIEMDFEVEKPLEKENEDDEQKYETIVERRILNSQIALWKKNKKEIKTEEYDDFYMTKYYDYQAPLSTIHLNIEGTINFDLLAFIPQAKPYDFHNPTYKKGLDLYTKGVLIEHNVDYLLPDGFSFIKGLVDSSDVNLNISREMLQKDRTVTKIAQGIENQIKKALAKLLKKDRAKYEKFYEQFGSQLMVGIYQDYGQKKELYEDLIMFKTNKEHKYVTLKEYIENNPTSEYIYYIAGKDIDQIEKLPAMEKVKNQEIEVFYFLEDIDEFAIQALREYGTKEFKSIATVDLSTDEQKEKIKEIESNNEELITHLKEILENKVSDVKLTSKLDKSAAYLTATEGLSLEMEQLLSQMPGNPGMKAQKILEINPEHEIFEKLKKLDETNRSDLELYANIIYSQAALAGGYKLDDPTEFAEQLNKLLIK